MEQNLDVFSASHFDESLWRRRLSFVENECNSAQLSTSWMCCFIVLWRNLQNTWVLGQYVLTGTAAAAVPSDHKPSKTKKSTKAKTEAKQTETRQTEQKKHG